MAGIQDALQSSGVSPVNSEPQVTMAGNQDALQLSGTTSVYVIGEEQQRGGSNRSSDVPHAAGPLCTRTTKEGLRGFTTPPQGKQRDNNEGRRKKR